MYLLDTNAIIDFLGAALPPSAMSSLSNIVDLQCNISIITRMEALCFNFNEPAEETKMYAFINGCTSFELDPKIVNKTIEIRRSKRIGLPDAIIAATALVQGLILITSNGADFKNISGLQIVNPLNL